MVRQLFKDLKDGLKDSFENAVKEQIDSFHAAEEFANRFEFKLDDEPNLVVPEIYQDECNTFIRVNTGFPGTNFQLNYRDPKCKSKEPPPPGEHWFYLPYPAGETCYVIFGFTIRVKRNKILSISSGVTYYNKVLPPLWAFCGEFSVQIEGNLGVRAYQWDYSETDSNYCENELDGYVDYCFGFQYFADDLFETGGWLKIDLPKMSDNDYFYGSQITDVPWELISNSCGIPNPPPPSPPPPPPKDKDCCSMPCCPDVQQNDQLLRLILKRIGTPQTVKIFDEDLDRKGAQHAKKTPQTLNEYLKLAVERTEIVSRITGIENFPITVPDTMIEPHKDGVFAKIFGFIDGKKKRTIHTIAELIAWMSEQDSAVLGQFHQVIEFETGEKDKKGKPVKSTVVLPNIAEALKEITVLTAQMAKQNNVQTEVIFKIAAEVVAARAAAHKSALIAADIQDYLDYPTETITGTIDCNFKFPYVTQNNVGKYEVTENNEDHKEFLKPGSATFSYDDWTGKGSLRDHLMDLLQIASMLRAILYQRTDK